MIHSTRPGSIRFTLLLFIVVVALAATAGVATYYSIPHHALTGRVVYLVQSKSQGQLNPDVWQDRDPQNFRAFQMNTITGRLVLNAALSEPGVAALSMFQKDDSKDAVQQLQESLKVDFSTGSEHMCVTLEGDDAAELKAILNAINKAYMIEVSQKEMMRRRAKKETLHHMMQAQNDRIKKLHSQIRSIITTGNATPLLMDFERRHVERQMDATDNELIRLNRQERELKLQLNRMEKEQKKITDEEDDPKKLLDLIREQQKAASLELQQLSKRLNEMNATLAATEGLQLEMRNAESIAARVNEELVKMETEMDSPTRVSLWEDPHVVNGVENDPRMRFAVLAAGGTLTLCCIFIFGFYLGRKVAGHSSATFTAA